MSEEIKEEQEQIGYILHDGGEYFLNTSGNESFVAAEAGASANDYYLADGTTAILVDANGQYFIPTDTQAFVLQDSSVGNPNSLIIDPTSYASVLIDPDQQNLPEDPGKTELIQYFDGTESQGQEVIFYTNVGDIEGDAINLDTGAALIEPIEDLYQEFNPTEEDTMGIFAGGTFQPISLQQVDLGTEMEGDGGFILQSEGGESSLQYQYAVLKDGKLHFQNGNFSVPVLEDATMDVNQDSSTQTVDSPSNVADLTKIKGRNLITGQTVTLHDYLTRVNGRPGSKVMGTQNAPDRRLKKKIQPSGNKKIKIEGVKKSAKLNDLLNQKLHLGMTQDGKKLMAKVIKVNSNNAEKSKNNNNNKRQTNSKLPTFTNSDVINPDEAFVDVPEQDNRQLIRSQDDPKQQDQKLLVKSYSIPRESYEDIRKTLAGLMDMNSVQKKLENKNLAVKVVMKRSDQEGKVTKTVLHIYGYMENLFELGKKGLFFRRWKFVPDKTTQDALLVDERNNTGTGGLLEINGAKNCKFIETIALTLIIGYDRELKKSVKVLINPSMGNRCSICMREFKTYAQAQSHMTKVHNVDGSQTRCVVCDKQFDRASLHEHFDSHVSNGKLFRCSHCGDVFTTPRKLNKHMVTHDPNMKPLECSVCFVRFSTECALKKHLLCHTDLRPFGCDVCQRGFVSAGDLAAHRKGHNQTEFYMCPVCYRKFARESNLARHQEIHRKAGNMFSCEICGASYYYSSSLTRHMVQIHINGLPS